MKSLPPRSAIPAAERNRRSRLAQLVHQRRFLRGTLSVRSRQCGKPNCRCAKGQPHVSLYLVQSQGGKPRQVFVPKSWEERIRAAVADYQRMQGLIEELSEREWQRLMEREE
jgi:hypothetical protein